MLAGILNVLKVAAGKKATLELPADINTSSIDTAMATAQEIADKYLAEHPASDYRIIVKFTHPQTLNGKPVFIEIHFEDWADAPFISLFLPFDKKENKRFMKKYKSAHNLSLDPTIAHEAFEYPSYYDWNLGQGNAFLTDVITHLGLNPGAPWIKADTKCSTTSSYTI